LIQRTSFTSLEEVDSSFEEDFSSTSGEGVTIRTTLYRWPVLLAIAASIALNSVVYMGIAPIAPTVRDAYNLEYNFWPNLVQMLFPLLSLLFTPLAIYKYRD
jgi:hypothetical protein